MKIKLIIGLIVLLILLVGCNNDCPDYSSYNNYFIIHNEAMTYDYCLKMSEIYACSHIWVDGNTCNIIQCSSYNFNQKLNEAGR